MGCPPSERVGERGALGEDARAPGVVQVACWHCGSQAVPAASLSPAVGTARRGDHRYQGGFPKPEPRVVGGAAASSPRPLRPGSIGVGPLAGAAARPPHQYFKDDRALGSGTARWRGLQTGPFVFFSNCQRYFYRRNAAAAPSPAGLVWLATWAGGGLHLASWVGIRRGPARAQKGKSGSDLPAPPL